MKMHWREFDKFLESQKVHDGKIWERILGESKDDYNEACLWVKVSSRQQAINTIKHFQNELVDSYKKYDETHFTLSLSTKVNGKVAYYGHFEGREIFDDKTRSKIDLEPEITDRSEDIFDKTP